MPHGAARDSGPQAGAALPQSAGETGSANEEQSERAADGSGCAVQPAKVHQKKYFAELLQTQKKEMPPSMPELLRLSRSTVEALTGMQRQLIRALERDALLAARVERLVWFCAIAGTYAARHNALTERHAKDGRHAT